jgi:thymidylate synthase
MQPVIVESTNLSSAWTDSVKLASEARGAELSPFILSLTGFDEDIAIRKKLDESLQSNNKYSIQTVASTIFPEPLYRHLKKDKAALYAQYRKNLPRLMAIVQDNKRGTYFQRLIDFNAHRNSSTSSPEEKEPVNQLETIIKALVDKTMNRRTQYQACIFDPQTDHVREPYQRFPCLGHITFYKSEDGGLVLNSFYPVQHLYTKAYGNWLGLINLGKFVARESGLEFEKLICLAAVQSLGSDRKVASNLI